ncbi:MAG: hypothetical protein AAGD96_25015 [Chloroflexota bacterium]
MLLLPTVASVANVPPATATQTIQPTNSPAAANTPALATDDFTATPLPIPPTNSPEPTPLPTIDLSILNAAPPAWPPALISGELASNYPLTHTTSSGQFILHYQPGTVAESQIDLMAVMIEQVWLDTEVAIERSLNRQIDLYLAGNLFEINPFLQGYTQSGLFRSFVLVNAASHPAEEKYLLAHELNHILSAYMGGGYQQYSSVMLNEGLAVYIPYHYLEDEAGYLPLKQICAAVLSQPNSVSVANLINYGYDPADPNAFGGHIRTFVNYHISGCFVGYLIEAYGIESVKNVFFDGDFLFHYGKTLNELETEWAESLDRNVILEVDPDSFLNQVDAVSQAFRFYIQNSEEGIHYNYPAYLYLNLARLNVNRGDIELSEQNLAIFWQLVENSSS